VIWRTIVDGADEDGARAARMDEWVVWEAEETKLSTSSFLFFHIFFFVRGGPIPRDLRTAHR
jgi:hypothetical protein